MAESGGGNWIGFLQFPFYYNRVKRPMDLGTIEQNIKEHHYTTVESFRRDIEQVIPASCFASNSIPITIVPLEDSHQ